MSSAMFAVQVILGLAGIYLGYVLLKAFLQAALMLGRSAMIVATEAADALARGFVGFVIDAFLLACHFGGRGLGILFSPLVTRWQGLKQHRAMGEDQTHSDEVKAKGSTSVQHAEEVLGLPNGYTKADLDMKFKNLSKIVHSDQGGSDWIMAKIIWARRVLTEQA